MTHYDELGIWRAEDSQEIQLRLRVTISKDNKGLAVQAML